MTRRVIYTDEQQFADIQANRQRFIAAHGADVAPVGATVIITHLGTVKARRVVSHAETETGRRYGAPEMVLLTLRPLTSLEKSQLPRDAAPGAPAEAG